MKPLKAAWLMVALVTTGALLATPTSVFAQDDVGATKHNLSTSSSGGPPAGATIVDYGEVCVYCHTPHGGQVSAPLWNRAFSTATYQMYSSSTIDMDIATQPTGISLACLSCHDGTIGLDVITNPPNTWGLPSTVPPTVIGTNTMPDNSPGVGDGSSFAFLGTDLRNDHPISVVYDNSAGPLGDLAFIDASTVTTTGLLKLFDTGRGDEVQCASCHNPHNNTNAPFLRKSNAGSALCTTCHIK